MLSALIPSRNERFLSQTVDDLLAKSEGEVEVIVNLDGYEPERLSDDKRVTYLHNETAIGMRAGLNAAAAVARGDFLMKSDAHCMFQPGYDVAYTARCERHWVLIPRRYSLDAENWRRRRNRPHFDYHYLTCPWGPWAYFSMQNAWWRERDRERQGILVDDTMSFQGSCYVMSREHWDWLGGLETAHYWGWEQEPQELGNKTWLGDVGGRVVVDKAIWYAHLHKGRQYGRMYRMDARAVQAGHEYATMYWLRNSWPGQARPFEWLVERFWPIPGWPENWRELLAELRGT